MQSLKQKYVSRRLKHLDIYWFFFIAKAETMHISFCLFIISIL